MPLYNDQKTRVVRALCAIQEVSVFLRLSARPKDQISGCKTYNCVRLDALEQIFSASEITLEQLQALRYRG